MALDAGPTSPWPQFQGGPGHAGVAAGAPSPPYKVAWTFKVAPENGQSLSAPIIAGGEAISVGPAAVYGVDLVTGQQDWNVPRAGTPSAPAVAELGSRSVLLYTDGGGANSTLDAIDLGTRKPLWDPIPLKATATTGVTVDGTKAFVGDADGAIYAVDVATGKQLWPAKVLTAPVRGPITVADGKLLAVPQSQDPQNRLGAELVALDESTGEEAWGKPFAPSVPTPVGSLVAAANGTAVASFPTGFSDGTVYGLSTADGSERWSARSVSNPFTFQAPAVAEDAVYVAGLSGGMERLDPSTGDRVWLFHFNRRSIRSSPVIVGDHVVLGFDDGSISAVSAQTGHLVWRTSTGTGLVWAIAASPDVLVAAKGGTEGGLVALENDPNGSTIDVSSPTVPRYGAILANFAVGFVVVGGIILLVFTLVARRIGPPENDRSGSALAEDDDGKYDADDDEEEDADEQASGGQEDADEQGGDA